MHLSARLITWTPITQKQSATTFFRKKNASHQVRQRDAGESLSLLQHLRLRQLSGQQRDSPLSRFLLWGIYGSPPRSGYPPSQYRRGWVSQSVLLRSQSRIHPVAVRSPSWSLVVSLQHSSRLSDTPANHLKGANIMSSQATQAPMQLSHSWRRMLPGRILLLGMLSGSVYALLPQHQCP